MERMSRSCRCETRRHPDLLHAPDLVTCATRTSMIRSSAAPQWMEVTAHSHAQDPTPKKQDTAQGQRPLFLLRWGPTVLPQPPHHLHMLHALDLVTCATRTKTIPSSAALQ